MAMNGAQSLIHTLFAAGVEVCFTNPGTTELQLVAALDAVPGMRAVLGLFEGVCTGAADGYARMARRPGCTLLHLGPGLANGVANLHNARRARSPIVNLIGDHATWHVANDPPLASDIESLARPVSKWVRTAKNAAELSSDGAEAVASAARLPGGVATLIVPADCAWSETAQAAAPLAPAVAAQVDEHALEQVARRLASGEPAALLLGGDALSEAGQRLAQRIAAACGCRLLAETFIARAERGPGLPALQKLPYFPEQVSAALQGVAHLVLIVATEPVAFFAYPQTSDSRASGRPVPASCRVHSLVGPEHDALAALAWLAERMNAGETPVIPAASRPPQPSGALDVVALGNALAALEPEGAIIVDEGLTSSAPYWAVSGRAVPTSYFQLTGGAIGQGLPSAVGAAVACPDRRVIALQADGSALYTSQALWTMAREQLNVTVLICANREYRILREELRRAGISDQGASARTVTSLRDPEIDWVAIARGMGVPAARVESADSLVAKLTRALAEFGPHLIEVVL
jgi:acetolactate synthase-1/2/3 large subunit